MIIQSLVVLIILVFLVGYVLAIDEPQIKVIQKVNLQFENDIVYLPIELNYSFETALLRDLTKYTYLSVLSYITAVRGNVLCHPQLLVRLEYHVTRESDVFYICPAIMHLDSYVYQQVFAVAPKDIFTSDSFGQEMIHNLNAVILDDSFEIRNWDFATVRDETNNELRMLYTRMKELGINGTEFVHVSKLPDSTTKAVQYLESKEIEIYSVRHTDRIPFDGQVVAGVRHVE